MAAFLLLAPVFLIFEIGQLILGERYLGVKQIARNADPRALGLGETTAFFWSVGILGYWSWMLLLLTLGRESQILGFCLLLVTAVGFFLRRGCELKWVLVILTFEGAIRLGVLVWVTRLAWRAV
jgi:hypothetical protein